MSSTAHVFNGNKKRQKYPHPNFLAYLELSLIGQENQFHIGNFSATTCRNSIRQFSIRITANDFLLNRAHIIIWHAGIGCKMQRKALKKSGSQTGMDG